MKRYSKEEKEQILLLKAQGWSSRKIAKKLDRSKSGINDFLSNFKVVSEGITEDVPDKGAKPRVLLLDLETAPSIAAAFGRFKQNINIDAVIKEGGWLLSYAYKWLGEDTIQGSVLTPKEAVKANDIRLAIDLHGLLEEATHVIWHNGDRFDLPVIKTRMILNGLPPVKKIRSIDTLNLAKEYRFNSNKLDGLCKQLETERKVQHSGIDLWMRCLQGDVDALNEMLHYNKGDISTLEQVYLLLRPHSTRHPNLAVYYGDTIRCNVCCSDDIKETGHLAGTNLSLFPEYQCNSCGARLRGRTSTTTKEQRSNFLSN